MRYEKPKYEFPIEWRDWCTGAGQPATVLWWDGRTWFAGEGSAAERVLLERGAVPVATLRFDPAPLETVHAHAVVDRVPAMALVDPLALTRCAAQ